MHRTRASRIFDSKWTTGCVLFFALTPVATLAAEQPENYRNIPTDVLAVIEAGEAAFMDHDAEAAGDSLDEDFAWYRITDEGPQQMVKGRDETVELLRSFFGATNWSDSEVHRLGMLGNILVQVEIDVFESEDGPVTQRSLSVYEFKNGKRWREWKFYPVDGESW